MPNIFPFILVVSLAFAAEPIAPAQNDFMLMTPYKWSDLNQKDQRVFTLGVLEYWGFAMYKKSDLSDFVACVSKEEISKFHGSVWTLGNVKESAVRDILKSTPTICSTYNGKGGGAREPLHILKKFDWNNFNLKQKTYYAMGYVEAAYITGKDIDAKMPEQLKKCMDRQGVETLMSQVLEEEKTFDWNQPLPWLIASALGKACQKYH